MPLQRSWIKRRLTGPGAIYNAGNLLALGAGLVLNLRDVRGQSGFTQALLDHLIGSPEATWLTTAMLLFLVSGEVYHRAYQTQAHSSLVMWGDFISGLAAIALTMALVKLGDTAAAFVAGLMLTVGKLGNAVLAAIQVNNAAPFERALRLTVVASRAPSVLALVMVVIPAILGNDPMDAILLPLIMIVCFLLWLWADCLLLFRSLRPGKN